MNIISILENRKSVRNYSKHEVNPEKLNHILDLSNNSKSLDKYVNIEFKLIENGHNLFKKLKGYGGYLGNIIDAPHYIVALTEQKNNYLENLGYCMEQLMIEAHRLGLGTCWIELFYGQERINKILDIKNENSSILTITPIGLEKTPFSYRLIKSFNDMKSQRKPVNEIVYFDRWNFNRQPNNMYEESIVEIVEYARLAPSWGNKQPWRFLIDKNKILLFSYIDSVKIGDYNINNNKIDCGIIMLYYELISEKLGFKGRWKLNNNLQNISKYNVNHKFEYIAEFVME